MADIINKLNPISLTGDIKRGGWQLSAKVQNDTDIIEYGDTIQCVAKSIFNPTDFAEFFRGTALAVPDNLTWDRINTTASLTIGTADNLLAGLDLQSIGFTEQASPANDHQIVSPMRLADIVEHLLRKHCNIVEGGLVTVLNILYSESVQLQRYNVQKSSNLWRAIQAIGGGETGGEFYRPFFNRKNEFQYQPAPAFWPTPPTSKGILTKEHLWGKMRVKFNSNQIGQRTAQVNILSRLDNETTYKSQFPLFLENGRIVRKDSGIFAASQAESDRHAERYYKWLTREYTLTTDVDPALILFGDDGGGLDLGDKVTVQYDGPAEDEVTGGGVHLDINDDFYIYGASAKLDNEGKGGTGTLILEIDNP